MTKKNTKKLDALRRIFGDIKIGNYYSFLLHLESEGISPEEFLVAAKSYFMERKLSLRALNKQYKNQAKKRKIKVSCPGCGNELVILPVTIHKGKNNVYGWKSLLECSECAYQNYSRLKAEKRIAKINKGRKII